MGENIHYLHGMVREGGEFDRGSVTSPAQAKSRQASFTRPVTSVDASISSFQMPFRAKS
jgi:hypothetical protein